MKQSYNPDTSSLFCSSFQTLHHNQPIIFSSANLGLKHVDFGGQMLFWHPNTVQQVTAIPCDIKEFFFFASCCERRIGIGPIWDWCSVCHDVQSFARNSSSGFWDGLPGNFRLVLVASLVQCNTCDRINSQESFFFIHTFGAWGGWRVRLDRYPLSSLSLLPFLLISSLLLSLLLFFSPHFHVPAPTLLFPSFPAFLWPARVSLSLEYGFLTPISWGFAQCNQSAFFAGG